MTGFHEISRAIGDQASSILVHAKVDAPIGIGAITSPWWLPLFDQASHVYFIIGGGILLALRIALAIREWVRK